MSETTTAVGAVFDLQRTMIEGTHDAVVRGVEAQRDVAETLLDVETPSQTTERGFEAVRTAVDVYFDAVDAAMPGETAAVEDARATVHQELETAESAQTEALASVDAALQESSESGEEALEQFLTALDEQFEAVLDAHEDVEAGTIEALDAFEAQGEELAANVEGQLDEFEAQLTDLQERLETVTVEVAESTSEQVEQGVDVASQSLEALDGLGPTYAERLQEAGIESFQAMAEATADVVAEVAEVSEAQAEEWIEAARSQN